MSRLYSFSGQIYRLSLFTLFNKWLIKYLLTLDKQPLSRKNGGEKSDKNRDYFSISCILFNKCKFPSIPI